VLIVLTLALLAAVLVANTLRFTSRQVQVEPAPLVAVDRGAPERLAGAIRFRSVSYQEAARLDAGEFLGLHRYLEARFPRVHQALAHEVVATYSLLFTWKGRDEGASPVLLLSHLDVVPVESGSENSWTYPPFAGRIADGHVWGRGAMDDKVGVLGLLEAVETLLGAGFAPRRSVYLAFGHDEEVGGEHGAFAIAALLRDRKISPEFVLDEGLTVTEGIVPGVTPPVALVGIAEKGYLSVELVVQSEGGHSSTPPPETAVGILATAIHDLERRQLPTGIEGAARKLFDFIGPEMGLANRVALANLWLFGPLVERRLAAAPATNALIRTTTAPTIIEGSVKENVLPARARAVVNFRIRPGDSVQGVLDHVRAVVDDPRVAVTALQTTVSEPSPESSVTSEAFATIGRTIRQVFSGALVAPSLVLGATDSRHYASLTAEVYRFLPFRMRPEDIRRPHGIDERISVEDYARAVRFYAQLIRNAAS
jgi:carboxypeptidase PM20D1